MKHVIHSIHEIMMLNYYQVFLMCRQPHISIFHSTIKSLPHYYISQKKKRHYGTKPPIYTEKIFFHSFMLAFNELTSTVYHTMFNQKRAFYSGKHSIKMGPTLHNYLDHPCMQNKILKKHTYTHYHILLKVYGKQKI